MQNIMWPYKTGKSHFLKIAGQKYVTGENVNILPFI